LEKVWKHQFLGQKQGFLNIQNLWKNWKLFFSELSENNKKMTLRSNFGNHEKLVLTQKLTQMFGLKFGMQGLNCNPRQVAGIFQVMLEF
jgi:hypothetical protein